MKDLAKKCKLTGFNSIVGEVSLSKEIKCDQ